MKKSKISIDALIDRVRDYVGINLDKVKEQVAAEQKKPLSAAIFGQTGCGKSSLTNAIFGTKFKVDDIKPCTKEPQAHHGKDAEGNPVTFWDLPGIGESAEADQKYLEMYAEYALTCDVVLWAFQADTRSMTVDAAALDFIVERLGSRSADFLNHLCVVMTKADQISTGPWIFAKSEHNALVAASRETEDTLEQKSEYFFHGLLGPYIERLPQHSKAVYCSARLKFNLDAVKVQIAQKGRGKGMLRLHQTIERRTVKLLWSELSSLGLPIFWDNDKKQEIFNIGSSEKKV